MSLTLSNTPLTRSKSFSKYLYSSIDDTNDSFLFVIELESDKKRFNKKIQKISSEKKNYLINDIDKIIFKKIKNVKIEVINLKNPEEIHKIETPLNTNSEGTSVTIKDTFIYLEIINNNGNLICFYNLDKSQLYD